MAARPGDTIVLAVGSQEGMTKDNAAVNFSSASDPDSPRDLTPNVRAIFNLYADPTSAAYSPGTFKVQEHFSYLHREASQTVMVLDLPTDLPMGAGIFNISTALPQPDYPLDGGSLPILYPDINDMDISVEILPGLGSPNPVKYRSGGSQIDFGDLSLLEPARQARFLPPVEDPLGLWPESYGAAEVVVHLAMGTSVTDADLRVVSQDITNLTGSKLQMTWRVEGETLTLYFLSTTGQLRFYEPRFSVLPESFDFAGTPSIVAVRYFNIDGMEVDGPQPSDFIVELRGEPF
jgi:hypothetical protein